VYPNIRYNINAPIYLGLIIMLLVNSMMPELNNPANEADVAYAKFAMSACFILSSNDKPQGRGASPRPAGGACYELI